ncbi:MAG: YggS family pyridoxal phosphate-dependent enzyme [Bacteroidota bacterium]
MSIAENVQRLKNELPAEVTLVAVSKTKPVSHILQAYEVGHRVFGENKVQEMVQKWEALPKDIQWHMIGHLQRNKVKYMAHFVDLIHGVDSLKLLLEIDKRARQHQRTIDCLLQVHIAKEETKFGLDVEELHQLLSSNTFQKMENIRVVGLMGMATFTQDRVQIKKEFGLLKDLFDQLRRTIPNMHVLSMGMSADYDLAIAEGSTMVRVGSKIFGARDSVTPK